MDIDIEKIKASRMKLLAALDEIASEHLGKNEVSGGVTCIRKGMWVRLRTKRRARRKWRCLATVRVDAKSQLPLDPQFVEIVLNLILVLQQPVNRRLVAHRLLDRLGSRLAVYGEEGLVVEVGDIGH